MGIQTYPSSSALSLIILQWYSQCWGEGPHIFVVGFVVPLYTISAHDGYPGAWVGKTQDMEQEALGWSQVGFQHQLSDSVNQSVFMEHLYRALCWCWEDSCEQARFLPLWS